MCCIVHVVVLLRNKNLPIHLIKNVRPKVFDSFTIGRIPLRPLDAHALAVLRVGLSVVNAFRHIHTPLKGPP